jgi:type II secretion system protein N
MKLNLPPLGPRARKVLKVLGYVFAGLFAFVYAFHLTFPYDRLKDKGVEALSSKWDVSVGGVERGWLPGDFSLTRVQLRTRPEKPGEVPKTIFIDRIDVDIALLSAIGGSVDVEIDAAMGPGRIAGTVTLGKGSLKADLSSRNLPLSDVPGLASIIGMPMGGRGNVTARLDLPRSDWTRANARISIRCPGCTIGGEGAFFKPRTTTRTGAFVGEGVPVPLIAITNLEADWSIAGGKIKTDKFVFTSPHIAVELEFSANVEKELKNARVENACLRYRGSDELKKLDEKFYNALELSGGPLGADDMRHLKLVGTLGSFKALGKECGGPADSQPDTVSGEPRGRRTPSLGDIPEPASEEPAATGSFDVKPAEPSAAPADAMPTPKIDDVKPAPPEAGEGNGGAPPTGDGQAPPEGTPTLRGDGTQPPGDPPTHPPPSGADSVHFEGQPSDENPQPPPQENE